MGLALALLLDRNFKGRNLVRSLVFAPTPNSRPSGEFPRVQRELAGGAGVRWLRVKG